MTPQRAAELLPVIKAFSEGQQVQFLGSDGQWRDCKIACWHWHTNWRIKPNTIKYRRYLVSATNGKNYVTCMNEENSVEFISQLEDQAYFICWIDTEWQEVEI